MAERPPVTDWATDFDHTDPRYVADPAPIWDELRQKCPVAHTDRFNGVYFPSRYEDIKAITYDTAHFSSQRVVVREVPITQTSPPITYDPPRHGPARHILMSWFTPNAIRPLEVRTREMCAELIDRLSEQNGCDAAEDYAKHIPARVIAYMLGVPESDGDKFRGWIQETLEEGITDPAKAIHGRDGMNNYFGEQVALRRAQRANGEPPGDDLVSTLLDATIDGQPLDDDHMVNTLRLLLTAGIDTTWSAIGASLYHLATHPEDRERLIAEPELMPTAIEELLRAYAPVTMARVVVEDTEVAGCPVKAGQMVMLPFPSANRDPEVFPDADKVILDRAENRHLAFGIGIHRCLGSNLARMELGVALEEWLRRIPNFELADPDSVTWSQGTVRGPRRLPVRFGH
ncbi:MAG TPA: cytochrome P450 [Chloroflexota bacterium]|nr:cytochrome P450 [Chloroflexota bacterium]